MGRSRDMTWGMTAPVMDNSDLWEEEISEDGTKYLVDGQWLDLDQSDEVIKVKGQEDVNLTLRKTHRGPLIEVDQLRLMSNLLFSGSIPEMHDDSHLYSFVWGGAYYRGDHSINFIMKTNSAKSVPEFI